MAKAIEVLVKGDWLGADVMAAKSASGAVFERRKFKGRYGWGWSRWMPRAAMPAAFSGGVDADYNGSWCWRPAGPYAGNVRLPS